jgi:lipoprotein-anchoring transpeptidase ErfK/SrfK
LRTSISLVAIAVALAGSIGTAAAQYYPPQPSAYPPPPAYPSYPPGPYSRAPLPPPDDGAQMNEPPGAPYGYAPLVYRDANGAPYDPRYDGRPIPGQDESEAYPPPNRPYFSPDSRFAPQPLPSLGGEPPPRPPADVAGAPAIDVTGTVRNPAGAAAVPQPDRATVIASLPPEDQPESGPPGELAPQFRRQLVGYTTLEPAGTIIIDTPNTYLYLVLGHGKAMRYGIGVGREGFTWSGSERVSRMSEWPDWHPPKEMIERQPYLPRFMAGGDGNPLGARALYLGNTLYRIHGTNQPSTIGTFVSSGCIRLTNTDIEDLYSRVNLGTRVVVLPGRSAASASVSSQIPIAS